MELGLVPAFDGRLVGAGNSGPIRVEGRGPRMLALHGFTGIGNDYQTPTAAELTIDTSTRPVAEATDEIERMLAKTGILFDELADLAANI